MLLRDEVGILEEAMDLRSSVEMRDLKSAALLLSSSLLLLGPLTATPSKRVASEFFLRRVSLLGVFLRLLNETAWLMVRARARSEYSHVEGSSLDSPDEPENLEVSSSGTGRCAGMGAGRGAV